MGPELRIFDEAIDIWRAVEERWRAIAAEAVAARGAFTVALSGGNTPVGFYCHLSHQIGIPWRETEVFQVDERLVPQASEDNNLRLIRSSLLSGTAVIPRGVHAVRTEGVDAREAASLYEDELRSSFGGGEIPALDLILLGIGEDGHTASLFPGGEELQEREKLVTSSRPRAAAHERITLTLPVLNRGRHVYFLATGRKKARLVRRIWDGERSSSLPASLVRPEKGRLGFFVDRQAGACD